MSKQIAIRDPKELTKHQAKKKALGEAANEAAQAGLFQEHQALKSENTRIRQAADLDSFEAFFVALKAHEPSTPLYNDLAVDPAQWNGITWGLVKAYRNWLLGEGYSIGTINGRLSTIKVYAEMSFQAGAITDETCTLIRGVKGFDKTEGKRIDETRTMTRRPDSKKADPVSLTLGQAQALCDQPATPQGRRDRLIILIASRLGLRCGEIAILKRKSFDLEAGTLKIKRPKVDKEQNLNLDEITLDAAKDYILQDAPAIGSIWQRVLKDGSIGAQGLTERGITKRVKVLGERIGVKGLSAHDLRHYWTQSAFKAGSNLDVVMEAGGWSSPVMPMHYRGQSAIANEGIKLL